MRLSNLRELTRHNTRTKDEKNILLIKVIHVYGLEVIKYLFVTPGVHVIGLNKSTGRGGSLLPEMVLTLIFMKKYLVLSETYHIITSMDNLVRYLMKQWSSI